mmetsp:Transcript_31187/g.62411  ORF Transcript_31187/g.62411 Transcript_31187/m.62411 type:complete len:277 (-) Transcript_31187:224-1054(-)
MGFYLLSSVLMMRSSLPREFRQGISEAAGDLEFEFMHHFFDTLFLSSFSTTGLVAMVMQYLKYRRHAARHAGRSLANAAVDELAGVRRHHHAVQAGMLRQRAHSDERRMQRARAEERARAEDHGDSPKPSGVHSSATTAPSSPSPSALSSLRYRALSTSCDPTGLGSRTAQRRGAAIATGGRLAMESFDDRPADEEPILMGSRAAAASATAEVAAGGGSLTSSLAHAAIEEQQQAAAAAQVVAAVAAAAERGGEAVLELAAAKMTDYDEESLLLAS